MNKKYPNHRFVLGYHNDKNIHTCMSFFVFVIMTVNELISGKRFTEIRTGFCEELKMKGYDVKATHKQQHGLNQSIKDAHKTAPKRQKGVYEVVDVGYDHYQNDKTSISA